MTTKGHDFILSYLVTSKH